MTGASKLLALHTVLVASLFACQRQAPPPPVDTTPAVVIDTTPRPTDAVVATPAYRAGDVEGFGSIRGEIVAESLVVADSTFRPLIDPEVCGTEITSHATEVANGRVANTVVWLADVGSGKRLPLERRFEILTERCAITPRVQAVASGGTLNVRTEDATSHRTRLLSYPAGGTLALVRQNDYGQVVPEERVLAQAGVVLIACDIHAWMRGWLLVFSHPYFAKTDRRGTFSLDSIPAGRYRIVAWHERLGMVEDSVTISAAGETTIRLTLPGG